MQTLGSNSNLNSREALVSSLRLLDPGSYRAPLTSAAAVPLQTRPALETLPTRRTAEVARHAVVDPLVVMQDAGEAEGLSARETHVLLLLRVDARVIAQSHGVGEGLGAHGAAEVSGLVGVFVVQEWACVAITAITYVACERSLLFSWKDICLGNTAAWRSIAGVGCQLVNGEKGLFTFLTLDGSGFQAPPASGPFVSEGHTDVSW